MTPWPPAVAVVAVVWLLKNTLYCSVIVCVISGGPETLYYCHALPCPSLSRTLRTFWAWSCWFVFTNVHHLTILIDLIFLWVWQLWHRFFFSRKLPSLKDVWYWSRGLGQAERELNQKLLVASESGDHEAVSRLLEEGADITTKDRDGDTGLHLGVCKGHEQVVMTLINHGINQVDPADGGCPGWPD